MLGNIQLQSTLSMLLLMLCSARVVDPAAFQTQHLPFSGAVFKARVRMLASDELQGRAPGTSGSGAVAAYLEDQFRNVGLAPPPEASLFQQLVPLMGSTVEPTSVVLALSGPKGTLNIQAADLAVRTHRDDCSECVVTGELVFVGHGVSAPKYGWDGYASAEHLDGKILVLLPGLPEAATDVLPAGGNSYYATDTFDTQCFPGFSLHDELEHLVMAGLTQLEAIKSATVNPARFLGHVAEFGSVAEGKRADLVILNADPLLEIANMHAIHAVVLDGVVHRRDELDRMLEGVEQFVVSVAPQERTIVKVDPAIYDSYVGEFEFAGFTLTVTLDGEKLMVHSTGRPPVEIYPESEMEFFVKVVDAQITFVKGAHGRVDEILLRQCGQESAADENNCAGPTVAVHS